MVKKLKLNKQLLYIVLITAFCMIPNVLQVILGEDSVTARPLKKSLIFF